MPGNLEISLHVFNILYITELKLPRHNLFADNNAFQGGFLKESIVILGKDWRQASLLG